MRNPKQTRSSKSQKNGFGKLEFRYCLEFRNSFFGFSCIKLLNRNRQIIEYI